MPSPSGTAVLLLQFVPDDRQTTGIHQWPRHLQWGIEKTGSLEPRLRSGQLLPVTESLEAGLRTLAAQHKGQQRRGGDLVDSIRLYAAQNPVKATLANTTNTFNSFAVIDNKTSTQLVFPNLVIQHGSDHAPGKFKRIRVRLLSVTPAGLLFSSRHL